MAPTNQAVRVTGLDQDKINDGYKNLEVQDIGIQEPEEGELLVKVTLRPINPTDLITAAGLYPGLKDQVPYTVGSEGVGVVEKVGAGVTQFKQGQRVVGAGWGVGTWAHYITVSAEKTVAVPENLSDETAAQWFVNPVTVMGLVDAAAVPQGGYLLQGAAGSTLGKMLIQYAKTKGIKTINIVRRQEQVQELKDLGGDEVINSSEEDVEERVQAITGGKGAHSALDPIGGTFTQVLLKGLRPGGTVLLYGALGGREVTLPVFDVLPFCRFVGGFILPFWLGQKSQEDKRAVFRETLKLLGEGTLTPQAGEVFPLEKAHEAIAAHSTAGRSAKVFLKSE